MSLFAFRILNAIFKMQKAFPFSNYMMKVFITEKKKSVI